MAHLLKYQEEVGAVDFERLEMNAYVQYMFPHMCEYDQHIPIKNANNKSTSLCFSAV